MGAKDCPDPERALLLRPDLRKNDCGQQDGPSNQITRKLYVSHFLSTWNSRVFEFAAVLYLVAVFPGSLIPMSLYALTRSLCAIVFAPFIGSYIDNANRLQVARSSIVFQRLAVASSCAIFYILAKHLSVNSYGESCLLVALALLACVEKVCSIMSTISVERDWVVVISGQDQKLLRTMNAQMRRIDMICKLSGPLFIATIDGVSTTASMTVILGSNVFSLVVEYYTIAMVYRETPKLQELKEKVLEEETKYNEDRSVEDEEHVESGLRLLHPVTAFVRHIRRDLNSYHHHKVFLPSFAGALLWMTVLNFGGQTIAYLRFSGLSATQIGILRGLSTGLEIMATWIVPWLIGFIGPIKAGLWMSLGQVTMLLAGTMVFLLATPIPSISVGGLVIGMMASRLGLRGFDLCLQIIVQQGVEAQIRGAFSSVESAYQNFFEMFAFGSTLVFSKPGQFKWPVLITNIAIALASLVYTAFVVRRRRE